MVMQVTNEEAVPMLKATPLMLGAFASAGAGFVHAAAAGSHNGERLVAVLFALTAAVQLGWAALALARPSVIVAGLGIVANLGFASVWLLTRTVGISFVEPLSSVDPVGFQDSLAAALAMLAVAGAAWSLAADAPPAWLHRSSVAAAAALMIIVATLPAMAVGHDHDHDDGTGAELAADALEQPDVDVVVDDDETDQLGSDGVDEPVDVPVADTADEAGADHGHGDGPITSLYDPRVTPGQRDAAQTLIDETRAGIAAFPDVDAVVAAGYMSIGDGVTGFEHFVHPGFIGDGIELDPDRIESIVARVNPDGTKDLVSAMYLMSPGSTMADVPDIAGALTTWHDHQDLCWEGIRVVGRTDADGNCPRGRFRSTAPMLHVWIEPHPCGPFAGLEGHGGGCGHDEH